MAKNSRYVGSRLATTVNARYYPDEKVIDAYYLDGRFTGKRESRAADNTYDREDRGFLFALFAYPAEEGVVADEASFAGNVRHLNQEVKAGKQSIDSQINDLADLAIEVGGKATIAQDGVRQSYFSGLVVKEGEIAAVTTASGCAFLYRGNVLYPLTAGEFELDAIDLNGNPVQHLHDYSAGVAGTIRYSNLAQIQEDDCLILCNKELLEILGQREVLRILGEADNQEEAAASLITAASAKQTGVSLQVMLALVDYVETVESTDDKSTTVGAGSGKYAGYEEQSAPEKQRVARWDQPTAENHQVYEEQATQRYQPLTDENLAYHDNANEPQRFGYGVGTAVGGAGAALAGTQAHNAQRSANPSNYGGDSRYNNTPPVQRFEADSRFENQPDTTKYGRGERITHGPDAQDFAGRSGYHEQTHDEYAEAAYEEPVYPRNTPQDVDYNQKNVYGEFSESHQEYSETDQVAKPYTQYDDSEYPVDDYTEQDSYGQSDSADEWQYDARLSNQGTIYDGVSSETGYSQGYYPQPGGHDQQSYTDYDNQGYDPAGYEDDYYAYEGGGQDQYGEYPPDGQAQYTGQAQYNSQYVEEPYYDEYQDQYYEEYQQNYNDDEYGEYYEDDKSDKIKRILFYILLLAIVAACVYILVRLLGGKSDKDNVQPNDNNQPAVEQDVNKDKEKSSDDKTKEQDKDAKDKKEQDAKKDDGKDTADKDKADSGKDAEKNDEKADTKDNEKDAEDADKDKADNEKPDTSQAKEKGETYVVKEGDMFYNIIISYYSNYSDEIVSHVLKDNPHISDPDQIQLGMEILLTPLEEAEE